MTTGCVALAVEGFTLVIGPVARTDAAVLQCVKSTVTGVQYCFYSLGTKDIQIQFDLWMDRFVREREVFHMEKNKMPEWTKRIPEKEQKKAES